MSKIVFDIETIGIDFDSLEQDDQNYILKYAEDEKQAQETLLHRINDKEGIETYIPKFGESVEI